MMDIVRKNNVEELELKKIVKELINIYKINCIPMNEITKLEEIGSGAQAKVYRAKYFNNLVTLKYFKNIDWKSFANELVILSNLKHPNIPNFLGIVHDNLSIGLIFEFILGVPLSKLDFVNFPDSIKLKIIKELCSVVEYIHSKSYIHRDIKPDNILVDVDNNYQLYLIDFGISKVCSSDGEYTFTRIKGTIAYAAPEMMIDIGSNENDEKFCGINIKTDVWSIGVVISYMYSGHYPWSNKYNFLDPSINQLLINKTPFPIPDNINDDRIKKIIELCTIIENDNRVYIQEINNLLNMM